MADEFRHAPEYDDSFETSEYEERAPHRQTIDAYDDETFWRMLADRLARRDLAAEEALRAEGFADEQERMKRFFEPSGRYEDELVEHGLKNIRLVPGTNSDDGTLRGEQVGARFRMPLDGDLARHAREHLWWAAGQGRGLADRVIDATGRLGLS